MSRGLGLATATTSAAFFSHREQRSRCARLLERHRPAHKAASVLDAGSSEVVPLRCQVDVLEASSSPIVTPSTGGPHDVRSDRILESKRLSARGCAGGILLATAACHPLVSV